MPLGGVRNGKSRVRGRRGGRECGECGQARDGGMRRGEERRPDPCAPSQSHRAAGHGCSLPAPVLTAAVTGAAGISIPGSMGGTIPGI